MDAPPPLARPDAPGLFSRYQRVIRVTFVGVLLAAAAVMAVEVNNAYETELELEAARMLTHGGTLSGIFSSAGEHVHSLRRAAETYLVNHPTPPEPPSPLYQALVSSARDGLFTLDNPPPPWTTEVTSNVTGPARAPDDGFRREVEMAFFLAPLFRVANNSLPQASWLYYVSAREFVSVFPWIPSSRYAYQKDFPTREVYAVATPAANPDGKPAWTPVYLDRAGDGQMVTISAPVRDAGRFLGVLSLDMRLARLNAVLERWRSRVADVFIVNDQGQLVAHPRLVDPDEAHVRPMTDAFPEDLRADAAQAITDALAQPMIERGAWRMDALRIDGTPFVLVVLLSEERMLWRVLSGAPFTVGALLAGLAAMLFVGTALVRREFIHPAEKLVGFIASESRGNAMAVPAVPGAWRPWFETIHRVFNDHAQLVSIRQELDVARRMQQAILPKRFPDRPDVQLFARMTPAKEVGGDFFDFFWLDERRLGLVIADVSDKGVPAALFMAVSRTLLRAVAPGAAGPADCLAQSNDLLSADNDQSMFVTVFYAVLDVETGRLSYANGGHNPPLLLTPDGAAVPLDGGKGMALGVMDGLPYEEATLELRPGAMLVCYTDGVTDAVDTADALFGDQRLHDAVVASAGLEARAVVDGLFAAVEAYSTGARQADDITVLTARWSGPASG